MNKKSIRSAAKLVLVATCFALPVTDVNATSLPQLDLTIARIRSVGNYQGTTFDDTIELWFTTPLSWPAGSSCTSSFRVYVDAKSKHLIAAAYLALAAGKKVDINVDDTLPIRDGACEVSYLDVLAQ